MVRFSHFKKLGVPVSCPSGKLVFSNSFFWILELCHLEHVFSNFECRNFSGCSDVYAFNSLVRSGLQRLQRVGNDSKAHIFKGTKAELMLSVIPALR